jgi:hypothetical protein
MVHFVAPDFNPEAMNKTATRPRKCAKQCISYIADEMEYIKKIKEKLI